MSKKEYPNNWALLNEAPPSFFPSLTFEELMDWKVMGWEIPSSVCCIMRAEHRETGKITEHVYTRPSAAANRIRKLIETNNITVANQDAVHLMTSAPETNESDE